MLTIDLKGRRALVAGVADDAGYGFAIAKTLAEAGASVCLASWPHALRIFNTMLARGKLDEARRLRNGTLLEFERVYPVDAAFDTLDQAPAELREHPRYSDKGDFSINGLSERLVGDFGERPLDIVVHAIANSPEAQKALIDTSRAAYLSALGVSAYSMVSMVSRLAPLMREGGAFASLSYLAAERVVPGYGGGMSSAKAALENDTRVMAFEAGRRYGVRVNTISAGPLASRAASALGAIGALIQYCAANSPIPQAITAAEVADTAVFLVSSLARGITGTTVYVDKGYHAMGFPSPA